MKALWSAEAQEWLNTTDSPFELTRVSSISWFTSVEFDAAGLNLLKARREFYPTYETPCMTEPNLFLPRSEEESDQLRGRPRKDSKKAPLTPFALRVQKAAALCKGCLVLEQCTELLKTVKVDAEIPAITGVLAGVLVDSTRGGHATREMLGMLREAKSAK